MSMTQLLSIRRPGAREKVRRRMPRGGAISQDLAILRRVSREARPFRLHILGLFILTALATPLALLSPVPLTIAVDSVIGSHRPPWLLRAVLPGSVAHDKHALLLVTVGLMVAIIAVRM